MCGGQADGLAPVSAIGPRSHGTFYLWASSAPLSRSLPLSLHYFIYLCFQK